MINEIRKRAENGDAGAQFLMGEITYHGGDIKKMEEFNELFGDGNKSFIIKRKCFDEMLRWYTLSAEQGNPKAQSALGNYYTTCLDEKENREKGIELLRCAVEQGEPSAHFALGRCYLHGMGVEKDMDKAIKLLKVALLEGGYTDALHLVADCYTLEDVKRDESTLNWISDSADFDNSYAQYLLGECYLQGIWVQKDTKQAFSLFLRAAEQEFDEAEFMVGECYRLGIGVEKDLDAAIKWYSDAAEQEHEGAKRALMDM